MTISSYYLEPANYAVDFDDIYRVRHAVFVVEQNIPEEVEFDELDCQCHHVLARDSQGSAIGTGRLTAEGRLGRLAVLQEWRCQRVGKSILGALIERARALGLSEVTANAQVSVLKFYQKFDFNLDGEVFMAVGIPHQAVRLALQPLQTFSREPPKVVMDVVHSLNLDTIESVISATVAVITRARRYLYIYSRDLEFSIYAHKDVVEALKQFALRQRDGNIQIIIQEPESLRNQMHPVIDLAQRLSSHLLLRAPTELDDLKALSAFIINDTGGYLFRLQGARYEGHWSSNLPSKNRQFRELFEQVWQRSRPCSEFRALSL